MASLKFLPKKSTMRIELKKLGKRYNRHWIFRNLNFQFEQGNHYAIIGPNGSGKSTLLQIISGFSIHNEGSVQHFSSDDLVTPENVFKQISFAAPYLDLIEEMTLTEFFSFHHKMKGWLSNCDTKEIILMSGLHKAAHKQMRYYSSGMKQRVKLMQAICSNVPAVLLDEPLTNLDDEGFKLYKALIEKYCESRLVIVSSNDKKEYTFCSGVINMTDFN